MKRVALMIVCALALAACGHSGSQFLGNWVNTNASLKDTVEITPNGDSFLVTEKQTGRPTKQSSATMSGDNLDAKVDGLDLTYSINKANGHMVDGGENDYVRADK